MTKSLISIGSDYFADQSFLEEVTDLLGEECTALMQKHWGGLQIWVPLPEKLSEDHEFVKVLGWSNAAKFCELFTVGEGGYRIYSIPMGEHSAKQRLMDRVREMLLDGRMSARQIALETRVARRSVFRIKAQLRAEGLLKEGAEKRTGIAGASREKRQSTPVQKANAKSQKSGGGDQ